MATIRRRRRKWQVIIRRKNTKTISKVFTLKDDAEKFAKETEVKLEQGLYQNVSSSNAVTLKDVLEQYRDKVSIKNKGHYIDRYKIDKLCRLPIASLTLAQLTPLKLTDYMDDCKAKYNGSTCNRYLSYINQSLKYAENILGIYLPNNPSKLVARASVPTFKGQVITPEEEKILLHHAKDSKLYWLPVAIMFGIDCGLRRGEMLKLKFDDINFQQSTAWLRDTKAGTDREIGISERVVDAIKLLPRTINDIIFPCKRYDTFNFYFKQLQKKSGVHKRFHETRHKFASRKVAEGWTVSEVAAQGGWSQLQTLKRYTHIQGEHLARRLRFK